MARGNTCNPDRLKQLLNESLPESVERELCDHVSSCENCRRELESLAAADGWWTETSDRLSRSSIDEDSYGERPLSSIDDDFSHFASDFAVDFLEPTDDAQMLGRLGDYEIVEVIGRGGMGIVLKGFQKELHRHVAVKVLSPHLATSGAARRRFAREAQATAAVVHPHVMAIHSVHANAKLPYLVMPFVDCQSLQQRLDQQGPLDVKDVLRIGMQAALGLAAAHAQGLVHRDVKPANILLETNVDRVLLTDFGLARAVDDATLTRTGIIAGTPQYMSPEQANGESVNYRSDLFSLGGVLYAMCTGRPPFRAETTFGVLRRIRETPPRSIREINSDTPEWLERIVMKLLEKSIEQRPTSAPEVASLLEQCLAHVQQPTVVSLPPQLSEFPLSSANDEVAKPASKSMRYQQLLMIGLSLFLGSLIAVWQITSKPIPNTPLSEAPLTAPAPDEPLKVPPVVPGLSLQWDATQNDLDEVRTFIDQIDEDLNDLDPSRTQPTAAQPKDQP